MDILILALAVFFTSYITFFSGFGLGTVLLPVFALFFPLEAAVGLTGAVHFLNNTFKFFIIKKEYDFAGAYIGNRRLEKVSLKSIQNTVTVLLFLFSLLPGAGII
ncbi:MAG TPA: hypothetical protein PL163_22180 [Leptospiraceae bacterium]|nr:hypothetical protein [Leptospiraceae bacterium]HNO22045.1 hypothetical protein [Leptospiraceae bacterium]